MFTIFCLPFAGGHKYSFKDFEKEAPSGLRIITLEYPGRGMRSGEPFLTDLNEMAVDIIAQIKQIASHEPYALYGHSMGAIIAWLVTRKLSDMPEEKLPVHLFLSGSAGPSSPSLYAEKRYLLSRELFIQKICEIDEQSAPVLANEMLVDYFLPILRSDFTALETYAYETGEKLHVPATVLIGIDDKDITEEDVLRWKMEMAKPPRFIYMDGGHFFIFSNAHQILEIIEHQIFSKVKPL